jgi:hypothetical protein
LKAHTNAFAERWVRSVKEEYLCKLILFGEASLERALREFIAHFHSQRNHQGKGNRLLFPPAPSMTTTTNGESTARNALAVCFDTTLVLLDYLTIRAF